MSSDASPWREEILKCMKPGAVTFAWDDGEVRTIRLRTRHWTPCNPHGNGLMRGSRNSPAKKGGLDPSALGSQAVNSGDCNSPTGIPAHCRRCPIQRPMSNVFAALRSGLRIAWYSLGDGLLCARRSIHLEKSRRS